MIIAVVLILILIIIVFVIPKSNNNQSEDERKTFLNEAFMWWYREQNTLIQNEQALLISTDFESKIRTALIFLRQGVNNNNESSNSIGSSYDKRLSDLKDEFQRNIDNFDDSSILKKFNYTEPLDLPYWYNVVLTRTWNNLAFNEFKPDDKFKWQAEHYHTYLDSLKEEFNIEKISPIEKKELRNISAYRLLGFGNLYDLLEKKNENLRHLNKTYQVKNNVEIELSELILAQANASLYGACEFHMFIEFVVFKNKNKIMESVAKYYPNFKPGQCLAVNQAITKLIKDLEDKKDS
jgi:hypothetical protein